LVNAYFPEAIKIYEQLNAREKQNGLTPDQSWQEKIKAPVEPAWAFQDWIRISRLEQKVKHLQTELKKAQAEINNLNNSEMMST